MTGILDELESIADANSLYGNTRDRRGSKRGNSHLDLFFKLARTTRSKIKRAQASSATKKFKREKQSRGRTGQSSPI